MAMKSLLRGPGYRRERRILRRHAKRGLPMSTEHVTVLEHSEFARLVNELEFEEPVEPEVISVEGKPYACPRCGATGDDRCVTASGKKTDRHAGRDIL